MVVVRRAVGEGVVVVVKNLDKGLELVVLDKNLEGVVGERKSRNQSQIQKLFQSPPNRRIARYHQTTYSKHQNCLDFAKGSPPLFSSSYEEEHP